MVPSARESAPARIEVRTHHSRRTTVARGSEATRDEHLELLERTRLVRRAAIDGDMDAVHGQLCELRNLLVQHLRGERDVRRPSSDLHARVTRHGQDRLLTFIERLLADTHDDDDRCSCLVRTAELRALLIRQIRLEGGLR
jgi:hypothetical protein